MQAYRYNSCQIQVAVQCERRVVIVVECRARLLVSWLVDYKHIGTIVRLSCNSRHIGAIGWLMYCMHIGTIIVCVGSSTVLAIGSGSQAYRHEVLSTGVVPQAYRRGVYQFG